MLEIAAGATNECGVIEEVTPGDLGQHRLLTLFGGGAKAVRLQGDERVHRLWSSLVLGAEQESSASSGASQFWRNSPFTFARNHYAGRMTLGDMLRFAPGQYGHAARKIAIYPDEDADRMRVFPAQLYDDFRPVSFAEDALRMAWDLATDVYRSSLPGDYVASDYVVTVNLLKYPDSSQQLNSMFALFGDSASGWTRVGQKVDLAKAMACGPFDKRGIRDVFGWLSLVPGIADWLRKINRLFGSRPYYAENRDEVIVGPPHTDESRALTMLVSDRDVIKTEVYDGRKWAELPMTPRTLSIFPCDIYDPDLRIRPTVHRYSIKKGSAASPQSKLNVSLMLGIARREILNGLP